MKALVLLLASVCAGQQPSVTIDHAESPPPGTVLTFNVTPKPLKCGKYERVVPAAHFDSMFDCNTKTDVCRPLDTHIMEAHCAPIMHEVTEKEWQELMERLKKLEAAHLTIRNNVIFCPAGKHPSRAKGNISWDQMCVDDAKRAGKE